MNDVSLGHVPAKDRWEFDESVAKVFDDMLARSIPQYDAMRDACAALACRFARDGTDVVDLGSSRGGALAVIANRLGGRCAFHAVETAPAMLEVLRARFGERATVHDLDLRKAYPEVKASVTQSILTLQFVPVEYRQRILSRIRATTIEGGALVIVEKVIGDGADVADALIAEYHELKGTNGYTGEEIERKRLSLEGVLVPTTAAHNVEMLRAAGFRQVDCFWRWMNFAAWIAIV